MNQITKEEYKEIRRRWKGPVYQEWHRFMKRLPLFLRYVHAFKGKRVLDVGCNAGIYGWHIQQVADMYIGVEPGKGYAEQARTTLMGGHIDNMSFKQWIQHSSDHHRMDGLHLGLVLYHLSDEEVELCKAYINSMDVVTILNRAKDRSTEKNRFKLNRIENSLKLLKNFKVKWKWAKDKHAYILVATHEGCEEDIQA